MNAELLPRSFQSDVRAALPKRTPAIARDACAAAVKRAALSSGWRKPPSGRAPTAILQPRPAEKLTGQMDWECSVQPV